MYADSKITTFQTKLGAAPAKSPTLVTFGGPRPFESRQKSIHFSEIPKLSSQLFNFLSKPNRFYVAKMKFCNFERKFRKYDRF